MTSKRYKERQSVIPFTQEGNVETCPVEESEPDVQFHKADSQIAINMVLELKKKIERESRFWKGFAVCCGLLVSVLACLHFYNEELRHSSVLGTNLYPQMTNYLLAENDRLNKSIEDLEKSKVILEHGIEEFLEVKATLMPPSAPESLQIQALRRALTKSEARQTGTTP